LKKNKVEAPIVAVTESSNPFVTMHVDVDVMVQDMNKVQSAGVGNTCWQTAAYWNQCEEHAKEMYLFPRRWLVLVKDFLYT
jgi:hypothetical protein